MADSSGAQPARNPSLSDYKDRLRATYGRGNWRITQDGTLYALAGAWVVVGRVGDPRTVDRLFPDRRRQRGVVSVELGILLATIGVAVIGGCTTVDNAISQRWPGIGLAEVVVECIDMAAERIKARQAPPSGGA